MAEPVSITYKSPHPVAKQSGAKGEGVLTASATACYTAPMPAVMRSYRLRAYPNGAQVRMLNQWFGAARWLWNYSLASRTKAYQRRKESLTSIDISRRLTKLKTLPKYAWLSAPPATCLTQTLRDQDATFRHFFRRVKAGENPAGYPRFRPRHEHTTSLRFQGVSLPKWVKGTVSLHKLGAVKLAEPLPNVQRPDTVTLKRESDGRYYITFSAKVEVALLPVTNRVIGVDLGLTHLATLSDGTKIENPRHYRARLRYLRQQQRCLSRRQKGSKRRERQRLKVARIHAKIRARSQYTAHQFTTRLVRNFDVIAVEDLAVKNMIRHPRLARSIADAGWGEITRQLEYKCAWYGRTLVKVDRWFPSSKTCSACGHKLERLALSVRGWTCPDCGAIHDRDINAGQNILLAGMSQIGGREDRDLRREGGALAGDGETAPDELRTGQIASELFSNGFNQINL
ncbi:transposase [Candidatus Macondimonas diazotrophica]|uniref:Transposase n=2 Tax=Candidatus Macondimonas diazotrophica TaxID=2305248 RepID=A0A4Z0F5N2_9GAMM|nr:transposase [Candidatus Macondimonas diazotrophica]